MSKKNYEITKSLKLSLTAFAFAILSAICFLIPAIHYFPAIFCKQESFMHESYLLLFIKSYYLPIIFSILFSILIASKARRNLKLFTIPVLLGCFLLFLVRSGLDVSISLSYGLDEFIGLWSNSLSTKSGMLNLALCFLIIASCVTFILTISNKIKLKIYSLVAIGITITIYVVDAIYRTFFINEIRNIYQFIDAGNLGNIGFLLAMLFIILSLTDKEFTNGNSLGTAG